jgi:hypothetical protein
MGTQQTSDHSHVISAGSNLLTNAPFAAWKELRIAIGVHGGPAEQMTGLPRAALGSVDGPGSRVRQVRRAVLADSLRKLQQQAGLPTHRLSDGRHTAASLLSRRACFPGW